MKGNGTRWVYCESAGTLQVNGGVGELRAAKRPAWRSGRRPFVPPTDTGDGQRKLRSREKQAVGLFPVPNCICSKFSGDGDVTVHPVVGEGFRNSATAPPMISFDLLCQSIFHSPLHSQRVTTLLPFNWTPGAGFLAVGG